MNKDSSQESILKVKNLKKYFPIKKGIFKKVVGNVKAVDDISFYIKEGETLGLVGESGCGKTTAGRCISRLIEPSAGQIEYKLNGRKIDINKADKKTLETVRREIQLVFQDPFNSLDSRMTVKDIVAEPLRANNIGNNKEQTEKVVAYLERVGLKAEHMNRYPHEFSGGQRQRIGLARSLILNPKVVIGDEPVSALDVSVQAQILNLFLDLQDEMNLTYLFIAHDLSVVEHISDRVAVMYLGKIVELAPADVIYENPSHPYTEALISAIPVAKTRTPDRDIKLEGSVPSPSDPPQGCNFNTRCLYAKDICFKKEPNLVELEDGSEHFAACHFAKELSLKGYFELNQFAVNN